MKLWFRKRCFDFNSFGAILNTLHPMKKARTKVSSHFGDPKIKFLLRPGLFHSRSSFTEAHKISRVYRLFGRKRKDKIVCILLGLVQYACATADNENTTLLLLYAMWVNTSTWCCVSLIIAGYYYFNNLHTLYCISRKFKL